MAAYKRQHYVPQFYLRAFSTDGKSTNLWNMKRNKRVLGAKLRTQCCGSYFYGEDLGLERTLGTIETVAARILRDVVNGSRLPTTGTEEHFALLLYVLVQHARTQYAVDVLDETSDKIVKYLLGPTFAETVVDSTEFAIGFDDGARFSVGVAASSIPMVLDLGARLLRNDTDVEFLTSDNPVVLYNQLMSFSHTGSNTGYATKGLQVFFPVSPRHLVLFFDHDVYSVGNNTEATVKVVQPKDVYQLNTLQMVAALENVYFRDSSLDVDALHRKSQPFRRPRKANVDAYPYGTDRDSRRKIIQISGEDVRTNLKLSFVRLNKKTKRWRQGFRRLAVRPASVVRDEQLRDLYEEFVESVHRGGHGHGDFLAFLASRAPD